METFQELKERQAKEFNGFEGIFWAFSDKQLEEGLKKVKATKAEIYSLGAGGYIRKDRSNAFDDMIKRQAEEKKNRKKEEKFLFDALVYELCNHEYCITGSVEDALNAIDCDIKDIDPKLLKRACVEALM